MRLVFIFVMDPIAVAVGILSVKCILNIDLAGGAYTSRFVESDRPFI